LPLTLIDHFIESDSTESVDHNILANR